MAFARRPRATWRLRSRTFELGKYTLVMGVLNVTPDSFSDGGTFFGTNVATARALAMLDEGAAIVDIGGESTRPDAQPVSAQEEMDRVLPVIEAVLRERPECVISVDTYKMETARAAVAAGAEIVNDVSGLVWDPAMVRACTDLRCGVVLMHTRGRPSQWKTQPRPDPEDVLPIVRDALKHRLQHAVAAGVERERVILDPGFGFGKMAEDNYPLLARLDELLELGQPLMVGLSRKSFLGITITRGAAPPPVLNRGNATLAATTAAILAGASVVRVHDVRPALEAARIADAILAAPDATADMWGR
ncbi:MAG TPA: dihydropteroate synthase [Acidobacteriaceae bacterium]|nr:dihydropteroate synthase [Acidobacteriaceae bacterium]